MPKGVKVGGAEADNSMLYQFRSNLCKKEG